MKKRLPTILFVLGNVSLALAQAPPVPIQAELVQAMEAGRIKAGDSVLARVEAAWQNAQCKLRKGAILEGKIIAENPRTKTERHSTIALLFETAQCGGTDMKPLPLTVAAIVARDPNMGSSLFNNQQTPPLTDAVGLGINGGMRSVSQAAQTVVYQPTSPKLPKAVLPGQVVGIRDVKLSVGTGPEGSSLLTDDQHNLRLEAGSQFVLVPSLKAGPITKVVPTASASPSNSASVGAADVPPFVDTTEACEPPQCSLAEPANDASASATGSMASISVKDLGYVAPAKHNMYQFDREASISYLGEDELLLTFNLHELVPRMGLSGQWRAIRGVLINTRTKKIVRTLNWEVPGPGQYLWPFGPDRVLIHVGDQLRVYGPGLKMERKLAVNSPIAFVAISPSSEYFAVGTVQERHSAAIHQQLEEAEGREPEEDVEVRVFDSAFHMLARVMRSSREAPPVLSDEGEIRIPTIGKNRWRVVENTWNGQRRVLAQVSSTCPVTAESVPPDLLFLAGCDHPSGTWYRVVNANGKPVLKGWSPSDELGQTAEGTSMGVFAIAVTKAFKSIAPESAFRSDDLESENIGVYRAGDGQKLFAVNVPSPLPTLQTFVVSPAGDQLAVFEHGEIAFYPVGETGGGQNK